MSDRRTLSLPRTVATTVLAAATALALTPEAPLGWARDAPLPEGMTLAAIAAAERFAAVATAWGFDAPSRALGDVAAALRDW